MMLFGISFEVPMFVYLLIPVILLFLFLNRALLRKRAAFVAIRCVSIALVMLVLAMPYITRQGDLKRATTSVLVIDDRSDSMSIYGQSPVFDVTKRIDSIIGRFSNIELRNMSEKERTALGDALYQGILGSSMRNNVIVVASDGNNNYGSDPVDVAAFAAGAKTKIFALAPDPENSEVFIKDVTGSDKSPVNSEYSSSVVIGMSGERASYSLKVMIDGKSVLDTPVVQSAPEKGLPFEKVFNMEGTHNITVTILPESSDIFSQNNAFNKAVKVIERPKVLLVTSQEGSPLEQVLREVYDVEAVSRMPVAINYYSAIVIDDQPAVAVGNTDALRDYLNDGGGLVVVGGNESYERGGYYESSLENMLPVKSKKGPEGKGNEVNVVMVVDISGSTGNLMSGNTKIDMEKAIAVKMIRDLGAKNSVGVVAFNTDAFLVQSMQKLPDTSALEGKISRLKFGGGTIVAMGLARAHDMLASVQGSKYVILISDGITNYPVQAFDEARKMADEGIVIDTIGVGFDTDISFMTGLANNGGGVYFAPSETDRVKITMGQPEEEEGEGGFSMSITDTHHFITEGLEMANVSIRDFNEVSPKSSAQVLAATRGLKPTLSVWRFGLGRVASLMVDDGMYWANQLYTSGNSRLISSAVNWAIGDPERKKAVKLGCTGANVGEDIVVAVTSDEDYPDVNVGGVPVSLNRLGDSDYYFTYRPTETGFVPVSSLGYSCLIAVNYPKEYGQFGVNSGLLTAIAEATGGEVFKSDDIDSLVKAVSDYTVAESTGVEIRKINLQEWFGLAALLVFLADVVIRRVREIRIGRAEKV